MATSTIVVWVLIGIVLVCLAYAIFRNSVEQKVDSTCKTQPCEKVTKAEVEPVSNAVTKSATKKVATKKVVKKVVKK